MSWLQFLNLTTAESEECTPDEFITISKFDDIQCEKNNQQEETRLCLLPRHTVPYATREIDDLVNKSYYNSPYFDLIRTSFCGQDFNYVIHPCDFPIKPLRKFVSINKHSVLKRNFNKINANDRIVLFEIFNNLIKYNIFIKNSMLFLYYFQIYLKFKIDDNDELTKNQIETMHTTIESLLSGKTVNVQVTKIYSKKHDLYETKFSIATGDDDCDFSFYPEQIVLRQPFVYYNYEIDDINNDRKFIKLPIDILGKETWQHSGLYCVQCKESITHGSLF